MKKFIVLLSTTIGLFGFSFGVASAQAVPACNGSTFDAFATGSVNGQGAWHVSGDIDQEIVPNTFGIPGFGCQSLRISDATTSVFIFNQVFSNPATSETGETGALDSNGNTGISHNRRFEAQFDLASVTQLEQPGMHLSVSPDRGDGTRMSSLGFVDSASGINVYFDDVIGTTSPVAFRNTQIATNLTRATSHTIKFVMDFLEGASNDIVQIFIDGTLAHTGTSWENFYRYDADAFPAPNPNSSRTVNSLVFYERGTANPADRFNGFLVDNVALISTSTPAGTSTPPASTSTAPVITLNGSSTMSIFQNTVFTDPGATATDDIDGSVSVAATGTVDTAVIGGYIITYTATDSHSNVASTTRTVNVVSTSTPPVITLNGSSTMDITVNTTFSDPGATAVNAIGASVPVTATGTVNTATLGDYTITYTATDTNSNVATSTRTVRVIAAPVVTPPVVTTSGGGGGGGGLFYPPVPGMPGFVYAPLPGQTAPVSSTTGLPPISVGIISASTGQVLGTVTYNFTRNLRFGSTGDDVMELKKLLMAQGDLIIAVPTKYFGRLTQKALMKWQKRKNLPSTGYFGPMSRAAVVR
jgi:hypothetical protein